MACSAAMLHFANCPAWKGLLSFPKHGVHMCLGCVCVMLMCLARLLPSGFVSGTFCTLCMPAVCAFSALCRGQSPSLAPCASVLTSPRSRSGTAHPGRRPGLPTSLSPWLYYRSYRAEEKKQGSLVQEVIEKPDRQITAGMKHGTYDKLDEDGIAPPGTRVSGGAVVLRATAGAVLSSHACVAQVWGARWGIKCADSAPASALLMPCSCGLGRLAALYYSCFASVQRAAEHNHLTRCRHCCLMLPSKALAGGTG